MLTCFKDYLKNTPKPIATGFGVGSVCGSISAIVALSNACSDDVSLGICTNDYADSQIAAATAGALIGGATGACLGAIYPACGSFVGWCYNSYHRRYSVAPDESIQDLNLLEPREPSLS